MGKSEEQRLPQQQIQGTLPRRPSGRCSACFCRFAEGFNFKCFLFLVLGSVIFASSVFWILPPHARQYSFDADDSVKLSATVQAYFKLQKPVSQLLHQIERLEFDINGEFGVPNAKVAVLSMHQGCDANHTDVIFGVLSDPVNASLNPMSLSMLRSSFIEVFLQQLNLTLSAIFGQPSSFEILKFPQGVTVNLEQYASFWTMQQILFNFTLINSLSDVHSNYSQLKGQLKLGLHLKPYENVYVLATNIDGSTINSPVTVQASITSALGTLLPERLKQLALIITESSPSNLGLDNSVFGKVKEISLSSYLRRTLHSSSTAPPSPSPSGQHDSHPPAAAPAPAPSPDRNGPAPSPSSFPPYPNSPAPSPATVYPHRHRPYYGFITPPSRSPVSHPEPSPMGPAAYHSRHGHAIESWPSTSHSPSPFSPASSCSSCKVVGMVVFLRLCAFLILLWR